MSEKKRRTVSIICIILVAAFLVTLLVAAIGSAGAVSQSQINALKSQQSSISSQKQALQEQIDGLQGDMSTYMAKKEALEPLMVLSERLLLLKAWFWDLRARSSRFSCNGDCTSLFAERS